MEPKKRTICFIITSKVHYARSKLILREIQNRPDLTLKIIVGASAILPNYGDVLAQMEQDGFKCDDKITMTLEGGSAAAMAKTAGLGIIEFTTAFENLKPDIVVVRGDRYEVLSAVVAAAYLNITVAHLEGGDISGTIDESVRHAITKLSHLHFTTNPQARERVLQMGEKPEYVFNFGCPELEFVAQNKFQVDQVLINYLGVGDVINLDQPYILVMQHPVTSELGANRRHIEETLRAVNEVGIPAIWFWPNVDAGTDEISKGIRVFRENHQPKHIRFIKDLPAEQFIGLLKKAACLVGNSSAGIKECSYLGVPVVDIGSRQNNRLRAENVLNVDYNQAAIKEAILKQMSHGLYPASNLYYQPDTAKNIVYTLTRVQLYTQKSFFIGGQSPDFAHQPTPKIETLPIKVLGLITARGNSKSIPGKNIKELAGKPLIAYTIEAAKKSRYLSRVIVSTDSEEIAAISRRFGAEAPFLRPVELATDQSTSLEAAQHALNWLKENQGEEYDYVMLLQPTSPLRTAEDIDNAIEKAAENDADSIMSLKELTDFSVKKIKKVAEDIIFPFLDDEGATSSQRQNLEKVYKRNCAIYLTKTKYILRGDLFGKLSLAYLMPEERSIDINQPVDFELAEFWLKKLKEKNEL